MSEINVNTIDKATGSTLNVGAAGTTVNIAGTAGTGFPAGTTLTGSTNNQVTTVTGANAITGEAGLIFDGSKLGIGTSTMTRTLNVTDTTASASTGIQLIGANDGTQFINFGDTDDSNVGEINYDHSTNKMLFRANDAYEMSLFNGVVGMGADAGNADLGVGLHVKTGDSGVTSPDTGADEVIIENNNHAGISICTPNNKIGRVFFADPDDSDVGYINYDHSTNILEVGVNAGTRMTVLSDGQVQINGSTGRASTLQVSDNLGGGYEALSTKSVNSGNATQIAFRNPNGTVGYINTNGSATSYLTSSDYRLKDNVTDLTSAITRIKTLKPKRFNFKSTPDETVDGFLAHEVSSIVPEAISGEKDAVEKYRNADEIPEGSLIGDNKLDENGDTIIDPQSIDQAKLVPLLVASVQELIAENETLKTRITALESA